MSCLSTIVKSGYVVFGSIMLTLGVVLFISLTTQIPPLNGSLNQLVRIVAASQNQGSQLLQLGQKLSPMLALAGAVCIGYGFKSKR
jgi:hypothetical protein